ncbi:MAG: ACP S-malonyltransferase [Eubacterium sp.]|nr:ACP S-malonyltransferase [Eubacterium sp.]
MSKIAFVFPGQGAQDVGMGKDVYDNSELAKEVFDKASEAVELDLKALCFEENDDINITEYTQVCLLTTSVAIMRELLARGVKPDVAAGLSLGEYCALVAAGSMNYIDAAKAVRKRGIFMQEEVPAGEGGMAAILGMDAATIDANIEEFDKVQVANYNCPGQIVISGETEQVKQAADKLKEAGAKRAVLLNVSGPFHSSLLTGAGTKLKAVLDELTIEAPQIPYVANVNASYITKQEEIEPLLVQQVSNSVRWQQSVEAMVADGVDTFIEIGPGKTLAGFNKKIGKQIGKELTTYSVGTMEDIENVVKALA